MGRKRKHSEIEQKVIEESTFQMNAEEFINPQSVSAIPTNSSQGGVQTRGSKLANKTPKAGDLRKEKKKRKEKLS